MRRTGFLASVVVTLALAGGVPHAVQAAESPPSISLPDGWLPEGIVTGRGPVIYAGSRADGAIYAADPRNGTGAVLVPGEPGRVAVGLDFDRRSNLIFVAGGATGQAFVHDATTGETVGVYTLSTTAPTFVNDVIVTRDAAYFTDSNQPVIYRLPLGPGGSLPESTAVETIVLGGDYTHGAGLNLNGIEASPDGDTLLAVHSTLGVLYRIDPSTGLATTIDLGGASLSFGDGLLLKGRTLYVVRNRLNEVVMVELAPDGLSGVVIDTVTSPAFDVPATIAAFGSRLYVVNARFTTPPTPSTPYNIVQVPGRP
jgi:sugar lactone lactonase YvrE